MKKKLVRVTTVPISLKVLLKGQLEFMNRYFDVIAVSSPDKELKEIEYEEGVKIFPIKMSRKITPLQDFISVIKMFIFLLRQRPLIVHTHTPKAGIVGMLASFLAGVPHRLHTVAGLPLMESKGIKRIILIFVERLTYFCATKVYPNSQGLKKYIEENIFRDVNKLKVIGYGSSNGIDTDYFKKDVHMVLLGKEIRSRYNFADKFVYLFIGRLVRDKGINELIMAFDSLSKEFDHVRLLLVGDFEEHLDPLDSTSMEIIKKCNKITHIGFQKDVRPYFAAADCFVFPSYREGFPNVLLQACSMELACIATDINGCNEIITDGQNGLIIKPKDERELYKKMKELLTNADLRMKISSGIREEIVQKYDRKKVLNFILDEYKQLLNCKEDI